MFIQLSIVRKEMYESGIQLLQSDENHIVVRRTTADRIITPTADAWQKWVAQQPYGYIGLDEVGRGPLAGPVVAGACWFPPLAHLPPVKDSKLLTTKQRENLITSIKSIAISWGLGAATHQEIDSLRINIACHLAMLRALNALKNRWQRLISQSGSSLSSLPEHPITLPVVIDGNMVCHTDWWSLVKGDQLAPNISAASILAKVFRDRWMDRFARQYPGYDWENNKGYGTKKHYVGLTNKGVAPIHRHSFLKSLNTRPSN